MIVLLKKTLLATFSWAALALATAVAAPALAEPAAKAVHRAGQTFVTWQEVEGAD